MTASSDRQVVGGHYEIRRTLGQGAFGHTFLARDVAAGRDVAVKLFDTRGRNDLKAFELFKREAETLRAVRHHGIPEIYESFQDKWSGAPASFLAMEFIEGPSLETIIDERRSLSGPETLHLFLEMLGVLDYLHSRVPPILHRDIKPSNVIVRPNGFPALVDFGSVRRVYLSAEESGSTIAGTYGYMPYEQYMGQASPASDLYALAATFLHLLTGRPPREFMNEEGRIRVPDALPTEPRLRTVLVRLLDPSPSARFASARDVRYALVQPAVAVERVRGSGEGRLTARSYTESVAAQLEHFPPAPRELTGAVGELMRSATPGAMRLMNASEKAEEGWSMAGVMSIVFFTLVTAGVLPMVFVSLARSRRKRMKRFFRDGVPAFAEVLRMELEDTAFGEKMTRVSYQFEAEGALQRDSDTVLPVIANRWQIGDRVPVLYLPERDCDSVIVAVE